MLMIMDLPLSIPNQEAIVLVSANAAVGSGAPSEPPTQCEIRLPRWCIAGFDGRVEVTDDGRYRTWALHSRLYMEDGPLLIVEDKACSGRSETAPPRELSRGKVRGDDGKEYISAPYLIGLTEGCKLEFRIPIGNGALDTSYEHRMKFGILACTESACSSTLSSGLEPQLQSP